MCECAVDILLNEHFKDIQNMHALCHQG